MTLYLDLTLAALTLITFLCAYFLYEVARVLWQDAKRNKENTIPV